MRLRAVESQADRKRADRLLDEDAPATPAVRRRGRPAVGQRPRLALRASEELHIAIQRWAERQIDAPNQSEAVRRLLIIALTAEQRREKAERQKEARATGLARKVGGASRRAADAAAVDKSGSLDQPSQPTLSDAAE